LNFLEKEHVILTSPLEFSRKQRTQQIHQGNGTPSKHIDALIRWYGLGGYSHL